MLCLSQMLDKDICSLGNVSIQCSGMDFYVDKSVLDIKMRKFNYALNILR